LSRFSARSRSIARSPPVLEQHLDVQRAGGRGRFPQLGALDAADALVNARSDAAGLHPHGRSKGASETTINYYHALKNAMLPVVTVIGIEAAFLLGGLIVIETVFNIPGVARFLVEAVRWRDYPMVKTS